MLGFARFVGAASAAALCLGFSFFGSAARAGEMEFHLVPLSQSGICGQRCAEIVTAEGEITEETPQQFLDFATQSAAAQGARNVLFIDSPGGNVVGALKLGKILRRLGTAVVVARVVTPSYGGQPGGIAAARCMSACVYAFMGGRKRVVPPESLLGIHRMFRRETEGVGRMSTTETHYAPESMVSALSQYTDSMGISRQLVSMAEQIGPDSVHIVTPAELVRWRLGTSRF